MTNHLICLALGETGVGKSSFINAITGKKDCAVSSSGKACTNSYNIIETQRIGEKFVFIDTPGLNDAKGDENNIRKVTDAIAEHPNFRAFLILLNFTDTRLKASIVSTLTQYMKIFPIKDFWGHTILLLEHMLKNMMKILKMTKKR
jgi:predicted GTPase